LRIENGGACRPVLDTGGQGELLAQLRLGLPVEGGVGATLRLIAT
jgi:hypothetical protein